MMRILVAISLLALGCSGDSAFLTPVPPDMLSSPYSLTVDGTSIHLSAAAMADPKLHLSAGLSASNLTGWPAGATTGRVWVIRDGLAWSSPTEPDPRALPLPFGVIAVIATGTGPAWPVGDSVDVVMEVLDGHGSTQLLRAPRTAILSGRQLDGTN
jgi:hypothetical protein